jgi:DNA-binding SARP family transcriptional activator
MGQDRFLGQYISLRLFGTFAAFSTQTSKPICITSIKARALLAYMAMHPGQKFSRPELSKLLWPNGSGEARQNLRQCKLVLQQDLKNYCEDLFIGCRETLGIRSNAVSVDVLEFQRLANSGDVEGAAELCTSDFLGACTLEAEDFVEWVARERARLALIGESVFGTLARLHAMQGRGALAIRAAQRLVKFDIYREDAQRLLIELYARYNGRAMALQYGERVSQMLADDLSVAVEPATKHLLEAVRRGDFSASQSATAA